MPVREKYCGVSLLSLLLLIASTGCDKNALIEITRPGDNALVNGLVEINTQSVSSSPLDSVQFHIDGELLNTSLSYPNTCIWDTRALSHASVHDISAIGFYANGIIAESDMISVTVYSNRTVLVEVFGEYA